MPFVSLQNMVSQTGHSCFYAEVRFMWTHGMLETQHWVLGFACFCGFGVICVLGRGRDDIRLSSTHGMQQTRHSWLAHAFLNSACKHFSFLPRACARWSCRAVGYVRVLGCRGFGYDFPTTDILECTSEPRRSFFFTGCDKGLHTPKFELKHSAVHRSTHAQELPCLPLELGKVTLPHTSILLHKTPKMFFTLVDIIWKKGVISGKDHVAKVLFMKPTFSSILRETTPTDTTTAGETPNFNYIAIWLAFPKISSQNSLANAFQQTSLKRNQLDAIHRPDK